jgi:Flp pilus assembly protein TadD
VQASRKPSPKSSIGATRRSGQPKPWLVFGAASLVVLLLYLPTLRYGFVWDDGTLIVNNPFLSQTNPLELFTRGFWSNPKVEMNQSDMTYYRPLSNLSLYVDRQVWGLQPSGYHLTNVIINTAVALLTCLLLWELFGSVWPAGLGGLLVGIHPAMNCVVTFISNRTYLLALFFILVSCYVLLRGQRDRRRFWPVLFGISLLLSALALEAALVFAAIAAGWLLLNRTRYRRLLFWLGAIVLPLALYLLLRLGIARVPFASSVTYWLVTAPLRVINTFGQQLQLLLFPFNQKVIYVKAEPFTGFSVYTILGLLFLALPLYPLIRLGRPAGRRGAHAGNSDSERKRGARPRLETGTVGWFGYSWMVLFLLPFAHLLFLGPSGRMLYLTVPGVLVLVTALYQSTRPQRVTARIVYGVLLLYTAAFAVQTLRRNPIWSSQLSLSRAMVLEAPESAGGHLNYGAALNKAGRTEEAIEELRTAVRIDPDFAESHISLAFALVDRGDLAGAIREFREVVRLRPESPRAHNDLALTLKHNGQLDAAIAEYQAALRLEPNSPVTLNNLGFAYLTAGNLGPAIEALKAALRLAPDFEPARGNLAEAYRAAGMPDSAALVEGSQP